MYGIGLDLCYDLFYLREPTKVGDSFEETLSSSSSEDSEDDTDEEPEEKLRNLNNRIISNLAGIRWKAVVLTMLEKIPM